MNEIRIVDYHRKYAAGLAKMWNMSADSWGGFDSLETEETVIQENEGSDNLNIWLAIDGEEVVGYCCFSEYREDEGASYIPLLNVRPDYQGRKVGKALVLKAVERACQCRWPRLDLYTWPGNTKAVPLYKKCGFFWEDRDDATHLMNFIPHVMNTEAASEFFQEADWYESSVRELQVEPDGRKEGGFEYLGYHWQHGDKMLKMEFERRGRGLRLMETEDWLISASVEDLKLVFGRPYTITYKLQNKSGKPLEVSIAGMDDKNIAFALNRTVSVREDVEIRGEFYVGEISEEQSEWRTHPGVCAELLINGKKALFKVGVLPKFPAMLKAVAQEGDYCPGSKGRFFLNLENNFKEPAVFKFSLPPADFIQIDKEDREIHLQPEQRTAVPVDFSLLGYGLWGGKVKISAQPQSGGCIEYSRELTAAFAGSGACFGGENDDRWFVVNGRYILVLEKFNNVMEARPLVKESSSTYFMRPQLGLPYTVEFAKIKPVRVEHRQENGIAYLTACYQSQSYPGIEIERRGSLQADGLARQEWTIRNTGSQPVKDLWFRAMVRHPFAGAVVPWGGKIVEARDGYGEHSANFPLNELDENWIFAKTDTPRGLCWPRDLKPVSVHGMLCFDQDLGTLVPGQEVQGKPVCLSLGTFRNWQEFRQFALTRNSGDVMSGTDSLEASVNGGNPFVHQDYELVVQEHKNVPFEGAVTAQSEEGIYALHTASISDKQASLTLPAPPVGAADLVSLEAETEGVVLKRKLAAFGIGGKVRTIKEEVEGLQALTVDNGIVSFSACPDFGPAFYSLCCGGREWLDTSFPRAKAKSWWNPWLGGSGVEIEGISTRSLMAQPRTIQFAAMTDSLGNNWQGIQIEVNTTDHDKFKGLNIRHNLLTLPGLGGICSVIELEHEGLAINGVECINEVFLAPGGTVADSWAEAARQGGSTRYKHGSGTQSPRVKKLLFGSANCPEKLLAYSNTDLTMYTNKEVIICGSWERLDLVPGRKFIALPVFYFFTDKDLPEAALEALKRIKF